MTQAIISSKFLPWSTVKSLTLVLISKYYLLIQRGFKKYSLVKLSYKYYRISENSKIYLIFLKRKQKNIGILLKYQIFKSHRNLDYLPYAKQVESPVYLVF
jgi:hypothetical protein